MLKLRVQHARRAGRLIAISKGSETRPVSYGVVLSPGGHKVSPEFGSFRADQGQCRQPSADITRPVRVPDKLDVYVYDGKTVKKKMVGRKAEAKK